MAVVERSYVAARLEAIQQELEALRRELEPSRKAGTPPPKLQGVWKGLDVGEGDITEAKESLFKHASSSEL